MFGTRLTLVLIVLVMTAGTALPGILPRKAKADPARFKQLADTVRTDPDERKRKAAVAEIRDFDPRTNSDVFPALVAVLRNDTSPLVRAEAAEAIGQFKTVSQLAGLALETAAETDPSAEVRDVAKQALWEYHLNGYRSPKGASGIPGQTVEPPLAARAQPRPPVRQVSEIEPPPAKPATVVVSAAAVAHKVPLETTEPHRAPPRKPGEQRTILTWMPPPVLNVTEEPPLAKRVGK